MLTNDEVKSYQIQLNLTNHEGILLSGIFHLGAWIYAGNAEKASLAADVLDVALASLPKETWETLRDKIQRFGKIGLEQSLEIDDGR